MFMELLDKIQRAYGSYSEAALIAERDRRKSTGEYTIDGLKYSEAMVNLAFNTLIQQKQKKD